MGNSTPNLPPAEIINEIKIQQQIVENLLRMPTQFYSKFLEVTEARLFRNQPQTPDVMRKSKTQSILNNVQNSAQKMSANLQRGNMKAYSRTPK